MAIKDFDLQQLAARLGSEKVLTSAADLVVYSTDVGSPPAILDLLINRKADAVVRPTSIGELALTVQFCRKRKIPMTPRGAATNGLGGAVPKRGGVVIDLTGLCQNVVIDEAKMTVEADAGVVIKDLQAQLQEVGLELPCYPTSANSSTIGGFVAMDGFGVNSTSHGNIGAHVIEVEGVGMDGQVFRARNKAELTTLVGTGGSTGIFTRVKISVVESKKEKPVVATVETFEALQALTEEIRSRFNPKHLMFHNSDFFATRSEALGERKNPFAGKHALIMCFDDAAWNGIADNVAAAAKRHGGELVDEKLAASEWAMRFFPIRQKKLGPSLVAGEVFLPLEKAGKYMRDLKAQVTHSELCIEGHVTNAGEVYFFIFALDDERRATYPLGWGTSARILWLARMLGGRAYHPGVYLQAHAKSYFGKDRFKLLKSTKHVGDPHLLMNPGMCFAMPAPVPEFLHKAKVSMPVPAPSLGMQLAAGDPLLMLQDKMMRYRRHKSLGVKAADIAADMARGTYSMGAHSDLIWGCDIPSLQAIPNPANLPMTQTMRGKMALAKAFVSGKIVDPNDLAVSLNVADVTVEEAKAYCPEIAEILKVIEGFRQAVQAEGVELAVKAVEVKKEVVAHDTTPAPAKEGLDFDAIKKQAASTAETLKAWVVAADCIVCNGCESACPTAAAIVTDIARVDRDLCIADGGCFDACPTGAIRPGVEDTGVSAGWPAGSRLAGKFGV